MTSDRRRSTATAAERVLLGTVELAGPVVHGYALDPEREGEALVVELLVDGVPHDLLRADLFDATLAGEGARNPYHGFRFVLPQPVFERAGTAEVRLANDGTLVGESLVVAGRAEPLSAALPTGWLTWLGGLKFGGWLAPPSSTETLLRGLVDENAVVEARPRGWVMIDHGGTSLSVPSFEIELPVRFADGRAHTLEVINDVGETLAPGGVTFVAFEDGLAAFLARASDVPAEQVRGALYDRLIPQSLPFDALDDWNGRFFPPSGASLAKPVAVVLIGDDHLDGSLDSLQEQRDQWVAGVMPWRGDTAAFDPADLVAFLESEAASCETVVFARGGTVLLPGALQRLVQPLLDGTAAQCVYSDVIAVRDEGRRMLPLALPAFDPERMVEQGYAASFFALSREAAMAAGRGEANSLFRLFLSGSGADGPPRRWPVHVPGFLARVPHETSERMSAALLEAARHFCAGLDRPARIERVTAARLQPAVRLRRRPAQGLVSVIVLARNDAGDLHRCVSALRAQQSSLDVEFIVVDNDSSTAEMTDLLAEIASDGVQIVRVRGPRNVARSINCGAAVASGAFLCFVDQHVRVAQADAIEEMLGRCSAEGTAAVGGLLTWPSGAVYDGGLVLNFRDGATRAFRGLTGDDPGYGELLLSAREVSAVSPEFFMVRREGFKAAGGADEVAFPLFFPSVAFCLANAALGARSLFTPHARAVWHGPLDDAARGPELAARFDRELAQLRATWPDALVNDPYYSPLLNLDGRLHTGLAWPPRDMAARRPSAGTAAPARDNAGGRRPQGDAR